MGFVNSATLILYGQRNDPKFKQIHPCLLSLIVGTFQISQKISKQSVVEVTQ